MRYRTVASAIFVIFAFVFLFGAVAMARGQEDAAGSVGGRVVGGDGNPLPGARVAVDGTTIVAVTDVDGTYRLPRVPAGEQRLVASYLGYPTTRIVVDVAAGEHLERLITLGDRLRFGEEVVVQSEPILSGQAKALNQQKNALNIKNIVAADQIGRFPDRNASEAISRLPGVVLERDQGEGRFVKIRGAASRLNSSSVNGVRLPAPEDDVRQVALDVIPADLLESIELTKALTPDMEADSIGGAVNLVTKRPPRELRVNAELGFGYNDNSEDAIESTHLTVGDSFADGNAGLVSTFSFFNTDRGSDNFEPSYDDGFLEELELRDYTINRRRYGVNSNLDYDFGDGSGIYFHGIYNRFEDDEQRRTRIDVVEDGEIERELKDRFEVQTIYSLAVGGDLLMGDRAVLDWELSWAYADEEEPDRVDTVFIQEDVVFAPNVTPDSIDPDNIQSNPQNEDLSRFAYDEGVFEDNFTKDTNLAFGSSVSVPVSGGGDFGAMVEFGGKLRRKEKFADKFVEVFEPEDDLFLVADVPVDTDSVLLPFLDGQYGDTDGFVPADVARRLIRRPDFESEFDFEEEAADYDASESVYAGYGMVELYVNEDLMILPGVRYEYTDIDYTGFEVLFDDEGDFVSKNPLAGANDYGQILPGIHLRYRAGADSNIRAAFTRTLSRPNYEDLPPRQLILEEDREAEIGNPELDPTRSWNFDLLAEHFFEDVGVVSGGFFYKDLEDIIFLSTFDGIINGEEFEIVQAQNGEGATVWGLELALQNRLSFLPAPVDGLGVYVNYTYTDSEATVAGREEGLSLPDQADHSGNVAVFHEKYGFSGRLSVNFHNAYVLELGDDPLEDEFIDAHTQLDLSVSQQIRPGLRIFADMVNLNDEPWRVFQGVDTRPIQREFYSWWGTFGLKLDF